MWKLYESITQKNTQFIAALIDNDEWLRWKSSFVYLAAFMILVFFLRINSLEFLLRQTFDRTMHPKKVPPKTFAPILHRKVEKQNGCWNAKEVNQYGWRCSRLINSLKRNEYFINSVGELTSWSCCAISFGVRGTPFGDFKFGLILTKQVVRIRKSQKLAHIRWSDKPGNISAVSFMEKPHIST